MEELIKKVEQWAEDKGLIKEENATRQFIKVSEEVGEVAAALARDDKSLLEDGIGDVIVTLIILSKQKGLTFQECLEHAYEEIKDRTGTVKDGILVKDGISRK